jgi:glutamate dehydrogenase (NADP+)
MSVHQKQIDAFMQSVLSKNKNEVEFIQAVEEVAETVIPFIEIIQNIKLQKF